MCSLHKTYHLRHISSICQHQYNIMRTHTHTHDSYKFSSFTVFCVSFSILSSPYHRRLSSHRINTFALSDVILMRSERMSIKNIYHRNNAWGIWILSFRFEWHNKRITSIQHHASFALILMLIFSSICLCSCVFPCYYYCYHYFW